MGIWGDHYSTFHTNITWKKSEWRLPLGSTQRPGEENWLGKDGYVGIFWQSRNALYHNRGVCYYKDVFICGECISVCIRVLLKIKTNERGIGSGWKNRWNKNGRLLVLKLVISTGELVILFCLLCFNLELLIFKNEKNAYLILNS